MNRMEALIWILLPRFYGLSLPDLLAWFIMQSRMESRPGAGAGTPWPKRGGR